MIIGSKNKGDWSEMYVLLYCIGARNLYTADEMLNRVATYFFPIQRVIRLEKLPDSENSIEFELCDVDAVKIYFNTELICEMTSEEFKSEAAALKNDICIADGRQFVIPHGEVFMNRLGCKRLSADSDEVTDIKMKLHDPMTGMDHVMGFSIKSYLGGAPTLLNASGATNFIYEVTGIDPNQMETINAIETRTKIMDRIKAIRENGGHMTYVKTASGEFSANLMMIDSKMEYILSEMLLHYYTSNDASCKRVVDFLEEMNPLGYPRTGFYEYKFKKFLCAKALGMDPSKAWDGMDAANGGYIVSKADGEVLAYHLYNRDKFEQYLIGNTKFERASTSRHHYASLYMEDNRMYIRLNLQIRFI